jgi:hypothetical protein
LPSSTCAWIARRVTLCVGVVVTGVGEPRRAAVARALHAGLRHVGVQHEAAVGVLQVNRCDLSDRARLLLGGSTEHWVDPRGW